MIKAKRILICGGEDILSSSIKFILSANEAWEVINISYQAGCGGLRRALDSTRPDIVIINQEFHSDPTQLVLQLLQENPAIKVLIVSLEHNMIEVYSKQKILAKETSDLITVIEN